MAPQAGHSRGFSQVDLLVAIIVIGLVVGLALPGFVKAKDRALEAEVKVNLWVLQVALERYASDTNGLYPPFVLGGSPRSLACASAAGCLGGVPVPEPLLVAGYISTYPANPFAREVADICAWTEGDPRFGCLGKALGQGGNLTTGNALSDPNYATSDIAIFPGTLGPEGFPYYFLGDGVPTTRDWLPGTFIYRTYGSEMSAGTWAADCAGKYPHPACRSGLLPERKFYYYYLAGYGSWRSPGKDHLHCYDSHDPGGGFSNLPEDVRCEPDGYDPWVLLAHEPLYGAPDFDGDGDSEEIPNVLFQEAGSGRVVGGSVFPSNADGKVDGLLISWGGDPEVSHAIDRRWGGDWPQ